jgi:hypothetical protein
MRAVKAFAFWLTSRLDPDVLREEALWLLLLCATPPADGLAIAARRAEEGGTIAS